jgi:hypothetical protein
VEDETAAATVLAGGRVLLGARAVKNETAAATVLHGARAREKGAVC